MKIKILVVDFEIPPRVRRWGLWTGLPLLVLGGAAIARAAPPSLVQFATGTPLRASDLNANFAALQGQITQLMNAGISTAATALPAAALRVETINCSTDNTYVISDCTCAPNEIAISGGAYAGSGGVGTNWLTEDRNGLSAGSTANVWRVACVSSTSKKRVACNYPFAVCARVQSGAGGARPR
jgi:hypothetical protein